MLAIRLSTRTGETPGPIPTAELEDPTAAMCQFCLKQVQSPPAAGWCCASRRNYILKVACGEHPAFVPPSEK